MFISAEILSLKNAADYQKQRDPTYREKVLSRKLAMKEQEIQDYAVIFTKRHLEILNLRVSN